MYYESKKDRQKEKLIVFALLIIIIALLAILILKLDYKQETSVVKSSYEASQLSTESEVKVEKDISKSINKVIKSVVGISKLEDNGNSIFLGNSEQKLGLGSGVILSDNGYILTNQHVVGNKYSNCYITLENGLTYNGSVVWVDANVDLAIVKITAENLDYINMADSDNIGLADEVYAIGNPIGIEFQRTVTKGIISGINRTIKVENEVSSSYMEDLIQTDATINEGNSGGPLINENGELIGINSVKISGAEGIGFAVPINIVKPILEKFINTGKFDEAYLGIHGYDKEVIPYLDSELKIDKGVYVALIETDSVLFNKDIRVGDIITRIDDTVINKMNDLKRYVYSKTPGDKIKLTISRAGREHILEIELRKKSIKLAGNKSLLF